ncbi:PKD domain-containing protein [uncultured Nocardioides sp.]|uniref:PKD domain-containing protein n=1 Tax=uncultured Nocardioides sp. TaxID=198441 RepID=UPI00260E4D46|nr:PKD domain-containing protein [uncultured Nocardioides sp.]HRD59415.1 PKD domain-containing protein [Nocardioides sp.]
MGRLFAAIVTLCCTAGPLSVVLPNGAPAFAGPGHDVVPAVVPAAWTPAVNDGEVNALTQVGPTLVAGGTFTNVTPSGGAARAVSGLVAFDATTGAFVASFAPQLNGTVDDVLPGPEPGTVLVAGRFTRVGSLAQSHVTLLDITTGDVVDGFRPATTNGRVTSLTMARGRLIIGGTFTAAGGQPHGGLAALDPRSGALDPLMGVDLTGHHNDSGGGAQGPVGVKDMEATSTGDKLAVIGNFKRADGLPRDQLVVIDVGPDTASVDVDWRTRRFEPYCYNWAFDTTMRGMAVSPDDSFFVVASTGGANPGTLCDSAARFDFDRSGEDVQPTWVDYSGGDTLWGVEITENAVYVGGHQRWMNNSEGRDSNGQGSVPRAGLAALDPDSGLPLSWNPGRNPRGEAVYAIHATPTGVWIGSNTQWVGDRKYRRPRLAFFPIAGGAAPASDTTPRLPGEVYLGGARAIDQGNVLYRVNAGGPSIAAADGGPAWEADEGGDSPYRTSGSNAAGWGGGATVDPAVPSSTPGGVFETERWSPSDNPRMSWHLPADDGLPLQVRLYFANRCTCTSNVGDRVFDVALDGVTVLDDFDLVAAVGDQRGTVRSFDITSDGSVDIDFSHVAENPLVNAIEVVRRDLPPPAQAANALATVEFDGTDAGTPTPADDLGVDWNTVRGAFVVGGTLVTAETDGYLHRRALSDAGAGPGARVDPYNDPAWSDVDTGSGNTFRGLLPAFYGELSRLTGIFYDSDRIYYTLSDSTELYWRWFNVDSLVVGSERFTASGDRNWSDTAGLFLDDETLYVVSRTNGHLAALSFDDGPAGGATTAEDSLDWRANAVFVGPADEDPPANTPPSASFTAACEGLVCSVDASDSMDPDGTVASFVWSFGDGTHGTGSTARHVYAGAGSYTITLEVTDDVGATATAVQNVTVTDTPPASDPISEVGSTSSTGNRTNPRVTVPSDVREGDLLVLVGSYQAGADPADPPGWTRLDQTSVPGLGSVVWTRRATSSDAGQVVTTRLPELSKYALVLGAYGGVADAGGIGAVAHRDDARTTDHQSPSVTAPAGAWVVEIWTDKSSTTTEWTAPDGVQVREEALGTGGGRVTALLADSGAPVPAGTAGGHTASTDAVSAKGIAWTLALTPSLSP